MRLIFIFLASFFISHFSVAMAAERALMVEVSGTINPASAKHIQDNLERAQSEKFSAFILKIDTPGGLLSSTRDIVTDISNSSIPVIAFVGPSGSRATSAGALILLSSHFVGMAPGTHMGAAHPVGADGGDIEGDMGKKATQDTAAFARSQALLRGRDLSIATSIVTESLSLSAQEAFEKKIADVIAADLPQLLGELHSRTVQVKGRNTVTFPLIQISDVELVPMSWHVKALHFLADPSISTMLISLGAAAIFAEISSGFTLLVPGAVGIFALILGFTGLSTLPIQTGALFLMAFGVVLLVAEIFIVSFGALFVAGLACFVAGAAFIIEPGAADISVPFSLLFSLVASMAFCGGLLLYMFRREKFVKSTELAPEEGDNVVIKTLDQTGQSGLAEFQGELWQFKSNTRFEKGSQAMVERRQGLTIFLK